MTETETSTADKPWPVRTVARKIGDWIARLGSVWVEGQVTAGQLPAAAAPCS